jgi:hypothetical protein
MNIKHSVVAPAPLGKRSLLQRFAAVAAISALTLGVVPAAAEGPGHGHGPGHGPGGPGPGPGGPSNDGPVGRGSYNLTTIAGVGDGYTGKLDVKGDGKFIVKEEGGKLVFISNVADGDLNMKDGRQKHTVGDDSKVGLRKGAKVRLVVEKSALTFPEPGKEVSGTVPAKFHMLGKEKDVKVKYTVKEDGGKYVIKSASFDLDYTKHVADGKKVCLVLVCVRPGVTITITDGVLNIKK